MKYIALIIMFTISLTSHAQVRGLFRVAGATSSTVTTPPSSTTSTPPTGGTSVAASSVTMVVTYASAPTSPTITHADVKYDANFAYLPEKDDGAIGDFNTVFPITSNLFQNDGTGYMEPWHYQFAITSAGTGWNGSDNTKTSWAQRITMQNTHRYWWSNHSWDHSTYYDKLFEVTENERNIWNNLGFVPKAFTIPTDYEGYTETAFSLGYKTVNSQGFGSSGFASDGNNESASTTKPFYADLTTDKMLLATPPKLMLTRNYLDKFDPAYVDNQGKNLVNEFKTWWTNKMNALVGTTAATKPVIRFFTHGPGIPAVGQPGAGDSTDYKYFRDLTLWQIQQVPAGKRMAVMAIDEWENYYRVMKQTTKSRTVSGNTVTYVFDQSAVDNDIRAYDMSLLVTGGTISNITVNGADSYTYKADYSGSTGLVNIRKYKSTGFNNPTTRPMPPQFTDATAYNDGNVYVRADSAITQSLAAGYSVHANTITGQSSYNLAQNVTAVTQVTPTLWRITPSTPVTGSGQVLDYRMQRGNAVRVGGSGMKVVSYIAMPITYSTASPPTQ